MFTVIVSFNTPVKISMQLQSALIGKFTVALQGRIQDLIRGGAPDRDRPKTAILGPQFCRILVLGPHFWWSGGARAPGAPPGSAPALVADISAIFVWIDVILVATRLKLALYSPILHL